MQGRAHMATMTVRDGAPTAGLVFNRPNPRDPSKDQAVRPFSKKEEYKQGGDLYGYAEYEYGPNVYRDGKEDKRNNYGKENQKDGGYDRFLLADDSPYKYRVPGQSVVNKVGDMCCTAAQFIWFLNLFCCLAHGTMLFVTLYYANWSDKGKKDLTLAVYRIQINYTFSNNTGIMDSDSRPPDPNNFRYALVDNGIGIDLGAITGAFFGLSFGFHLLVLYMGLNPKWWYYYWRQMDDGFCWWRWLEYTGSASVMAMGIAASLGMREENILASIFLLHVCTMACGFATELWSRPKYYPDGEDYQWKVGETFKYYKDPKVRRSEGTLVEKEGFEGQEAYSQYKAVKNVDGSITYLPGNPRALKLISQDEWEGDRPLRWWNKKRGVWYAYEYNNTSISLQYFNNFVRRMLPHAFGYIPMTGAWVMMIKFLETSKLDVKRLHNDDSLEMPDWVSILLYGTVIIFWSFSVVQIIFQFLPPNFYWGSEVIYCILSLTSKMYLGLFLLINVILADGTAEETLGGI